MRGVRLDRCCMSAPDSDRRTWSGSALAAGGALAVLWAAALWTAGWRTAAAAEEPDPSAEAAQAAALVEQLGANRFAERERAQRALVRLGLPALEALEAAAEHADPEIRRRARAVLAIVQRMDLEARLEAFVQSDAPGDDPHLPYWPRFRALAGESRAARELFAEIVRAEFPLLQAVADDPLDAGQLLGVRARRLQDLNTGVFGGVDEEPTLGNLLALLLVGADERVPVGDWGVVISNFASHQALAETLQTQEQQPVVHAIVVAWIRRDFSPLQYVLYNNLMLAITRSLPQAIYPARALLRMDGSFSQQRVFALLAAAEHGCVQDAPLIERWLTDENVVQTAEGGRILQLRDVGLAALIRLHGLDLGEFGFTAAAPAEYFGYVPASLGFTSEEDRAAALAAWRDWQAENAPAEAPPAD